MDIACDPPHKQTAPATYQHIPQEQLQRLEESKKIKKMLQTPGLRSLIQTVTSSTRPRETLQQLRSDYPQFEEFVNDLLDCIDFHPTREARTLQPTLVQALFQSLGIDISQLDE